jgi:hypothetical protein
MQENILESFKYFDNSVKKYKEYYKINIKNKLNFKVNLIDDIPVFELKNDKKILMKGDYNLIGIFGKKENTNIKYFRWGWDLLYHTNKDNKNESDTYYINNKEIVTNKNEEIIYNINNTYYIKKIINYIFDLKINVNNYKEMFFYEDMKKIFLRHMIEIENPLQLDLLLAMTLYITKSNLIWKENDDDNMITRYYLLRNVQEL